MVEMTRWKKTEKRRQFQYSERNWQKLVLSLGDGNVHCVLQYGTSRDIVRVDCVRLLSEWHRSSVGSWMEIE